MKYRGSWHEAKASTFSASRQPRGEASASRTTSLEDCHPSIRDLRRRSPGLPSQTIARTVSSELLGFCF